MGAENEGCDVASCGAARRSAVVADNCGLKSALQPTYTSQDEHVVLLAVSLYLPIVPESAR